MSMLTRDKEGIPHGLCDHLRIFFHDECTDMGDVI
jgi:hypothetical protein